MVNEKFCYSDDLLFLILFVQTMFVLSYSFNNDANYLRWMGSCFKKSIVTCDDNITMFSVSNMHTFPSV